VDRWGLDAQEKLASARARLVAALDEVEQAEKLVASDLPTTVRVLERTSRRKLAFLREEHG